MSSGVIVDTASKNVVLFYAKLDFFYAKLDFFYA